MALTARLTEEQRSARSPWVEGELVLLPLLPEEGSCSCQEPMREGFRYQKSRLGLGLGPLRPWRPPRVLV